MKFGIGQRVQRVEDLRLLYGGGSYVDDTTLENQLHAAVLRSPVAHARIRSIDAAGAADADGVKAVWLWDDIRGKLNPLVNEFPLGIEYADIHLPHLASDSVRYVGQPVAFAVAETRAAAEEALETIEIDYEDLPAVPGPVEAMKPGAAQLHGEAPGNVAYLWSCGDADAVATAFERAHRIVRTDVLNQRVVVASLESRGINVRYLPEDDRWEVWISSQGAFGMRAKIAKNLGVEPERVRVHVEDVGGAFGMKLMDHPEYGLAALAARELGRPVKWVGSRSESFLSDAQGRDMRAEVEGAFDADGRCRAMRMRSVSGLGAYYSTFGAGVHTAFSAPLLGGMYAIEAHHAEVHGVFYNAPPTDAYRGAGRPEAIYATERLMEAAARELGIDRAEIRRRNLVTPDQLPYKTPGGLTFDSLDTHRVLDRALEASDYAGFDARAEASRAAGKHRGLGLTYYFERTGGGPVENTRMELGPDGSMRIWIGTQASGQGHETAWAQIAHEKLGIPVEQVRVMAGDSDALPHGGGTGGSRSAVMASRVLLLGSEDIIGKARVLAADKLEAAEADIEFDPEASEFRIAGTDRQVSLMELAADAGGITGTGHVDGRESTFPNGCHVCEVEIDAETGKLDIVAYTVIDDFGTLINPDIAAGQVHGGVVQGIGQVIGEQAVWDAETGQPITGSFMDYQLPRASDVPSFDLDFEVVPCKTNPLGVKGCGESGSVASISACALAVQDALWRAGVRDMPETPYTPLKLWESLMRAA